MYEPAIFLYEIRDTEKTLLQKGILEAYEAYIKIGDIQQHVNRNGFIFEKVLFLVYLFYFIV